MKFVIWEISFIQWSIYKLIFTLSTLSTMEKLTDVYGPITKLVNSFPVGLIIEPLSLIDGSIS